MVIKYLFLFCRSELKESLPAASACELVVVIARSHSLLTASTGRKRKASLGLQREQHTFDYIENEFMQEVLNLCVILSVIIFLNFRVACCPSVTQLVLKLIRSLEESGIRVTLL